MIQTIAGNLLVASARIQDGPQAQSVCLTIHEDHEKVIGLLINRPLHVVPPIGLPPMGIAGGSALPSTSVPPASSISISQTQLPDELAGFDSLSWGGPMPGPVVALHGNQDLAENQAADGLYLSADRDVIEKLGKSNDSTARIFVGCVGWPIQQIQAEIHSGWWHSVPTQSDIVFSDPDDMWKNLIRRATGRTLASWIKAPDDPQACWLN